MSKQNTDAANQTRSHLPAANLETIGVRVDGELKQAAEELFASRGITMSQAIREFLRRSIKRSQDQYYCQKKDVVNVMGGINIGDSQKIQLVSKRTRVDC